MSATNDLERRIADHYEAEAPARAPDWLLERVLASVETTGQRRTILGLAWRTNPMNTFARSIAAAAAVVVVAVVASAVLPGLGIVGPGASPSPSPSLSPSLLARGDFVTIRRGAVTLEAFGDGSSVTGRMTVSSEGASFTVDLQCARTTEDGLVMIGGSTIETANGGSGLSPVGTWAGVVLRRGSPVQATVWSQRGGGTGATSCLAYLDERFDEKLMDPVIDDDDPAPIGGTVEFGP